MLVTNSLQFSYTSKTTFNFPDLQCKAGDVLLITGASGTGKTTLLHLLGGILSPEKGRIAIGETDIATLREKKLDRFRGKNIGIVFQQSHFVQSFSVLENLLLTQWFANRKKNKEKIISILHKLNIADQANKRTARLSQGQQQRVSIARALINNPQLILADEPTSSLDDEHCMQVANLLQNQAAESDAALVIVTHDHRLKSIFPNSIQLT